MEKIVADTSVIISGQLALQVGSGTVRNAEIIIPQAVLDELQSQAARGREQGFAGLESLGDLNRMAGDAGITVTVSGDHPTASDVELAGTGRIDALIADVARHNGATLYTSDRLLHTVARAEGIGAVLLRTEARREELEFLRFFDNTTMSVHLKEGQPPLAKRGKPGSFALERVSDEPLQKKELERMASQILGAAGTGADSMEISGTGASVVQYGEYRIAITHRPFSESFEITIVHPTTQMSLEDYGMPEKLLERLSDSAEGIIISGPPGSGKSTLASGLGNFYHSRGRIVKTFESPRDLQVDPGITQYSRLDGSFENTADILLLVRPDYTIFDEVRRREDFATFADLRLTGVGMVGVVHANTPIDAIQRFIGKIELGMIPSVLDTVVFVKDGRIDAVYSLQLVVKVPSGMTESDLARPVIEVKDFVGDSLSHEIYTFGEENVIVPVSADAKKSGVERLAEERLQEIFARYDPGARAEVKSAGRARIEVEERSIPGIIGRGGSKISELEKSLGVGLDIVPREGGGSGRGGDRDGYRDGRRGRGRDGGRGGERHRDGDRDRGGERRRGGDPDGYRDGGRGRGRDGHGGEPGGGRDIDFAVSESKHFLFLDVGRKYSSMVADVHAGDRHVSSERIGRQGQIRIHMRSDAARQLTDDGGPRGDIRVCLRE